MSYSQSSSKSYYSSSSSGGPGHTQVTERTTVIGPDGNPQTETRSYSSGVQSGFGKGLGKLGGWMEQGGRMVDNISGAMNNIGFGDGGLVKVKSHPTEARYKKGWGNRGASYDKYKPPQQLDGKNYKEIKAECLAKGILFEDPDFPAVDKSIFYSRSPPRPFEWKRPPDICNDPQLFVGGASRFDVQQGELGDCWLLAAVACLCGDKALLHRVAPTNQSFTDQYAGIFHFQFWRFGKWEDVIVDDRLPTYNGRLTFLHSAENNEFWTALLEKAYAKLMGSYEALKGGSTSEAMEDFTGGVTEMFDLRVEVPPNLFQDMIKAKARSSLMGCSIEAMPGKLEAELDNGLIMGHAYSITDVKAVDIQTSRMKGKIPMVRIRNPWGNECEWKGAWSDKSPEWRFISESERQDMGLTFSDDGEFWMAYTDFVKNFQKLEICHLGPNELDPGTKRWEATQLDGGWKKRVNAGGCRNYLDTFWTNPQYQVEVVDADDDDDDNGTLIVALMQKDRRKLRKEGLDMLTCGYAIYPIKPENSSQPLDMRFFKYNASTAKSPSFINLREVCGRHKLKPGKYCVIPSTFEPNQEGEFILRIFSEKENVSEEMDEETGISDVQIPSTPRRSSSSSSSGTPTSSGSQPSFPKYKPVYNNNDPVGYLGEFLSKAEPSVPKPATRVAKVVHIEDTEDGKRKFRFFPFWDDFPSMDFRFPWEKRREPFEFPTFSTLFKSSPAEQAVNEQGLRSMASRSLTSDQKPVEEVIVATKAKRFTGERKLSQEENEENCEPVEEIIEAKAAVQQTGERRPDPEPMASMSEPVPVEELIIPKKALRQTGELRQSIEEQIKPENVERVMAVVNSLPLPEVEMSDSDRAQDEAMRGAFTKIAGEDMEIDAYELLDILNAAFAKEFSFKGFTADTSRSLVAMMDEDQSGKLGFPEFKKLWNDLRLWKGVFKKYDADKSGNFNSYELRMAFHAIGLRVSNSTFNSLVMRYSHRDGKIHFDDFIHCVARLKTMFDVYKSQQNGKKAEFTLDEFIQTTMYS